MKTLLLYLATAIAEIVGCYLPLLWLRGQGSGWVLLPAAAVSHIRLAAHPARRALGPCVRGLRWGLCGVNVPAAQ